MDVCIVLSVVDGQTQLKLVEFLESEFGQKDGELSMVYSFFFEPVSNLNLTQFF